VRPADIPAGAFLMFIQEERAMRTQSLSRRGVTATLVAALRRDGPRRLRADRSVVLLLMRSSPMTSSLERATLVRRPDFRFKGEIGRTYQDSDPAAFPQIVRPPKGVPNIVLILLDDVGYGQFSVFGGGVSSPNMENLAAQGLRYNRFHTILIRVKCLNRGHNQ
jgi:hypothetical protein